MNEKILVIKENIKAKILKEIDKSLDDVATEMQGLKRDGEQLQNENAKLRNELADKRDVLEDFMVRYIAHNTVVTLWEKEIFKENGAYKHRYEKLWSGMDWQIAPDYEESVYFYNHPDVEPCPYSTHYVEQVIGNPEEGGINTVDSIHLVIGECKYSI